MCGSTVIIETSQSRSYPGHRDEVPRRTRSRLIRGSCSPGALAHFSEDRGLKAFLGREIIAWAVRFMAAPPVPESGRPPDRPDSLSCRFTIRRRPMPGMSSATTRSADLRASHDPTRELRAAAARPGRHQSPPRPRAPMRMTARRKTPSHRAVCLLPKMVSAKRRRGPDSIRVMPSIPILRTAESGYRRRRLAASDRQPNLFTCDFR